MLGADQGRRAERDGLQAARIDDIERDQEFVPDEDRAEQGGRDHARPDDRQHDSPQEAEIGAAVDLGGIVDLARHLVEEADHDPDDQRQREGGVGQDQAEIGVAQADLPDHQEQRDGDRDRRHESHAEDGVADLLLAAERQSREGVGGRRADDQRQQRGNPDHEDRIADEFEHALAVQHLAVAAGDRLPLERQRRRHLGQDVDAPLEGENQHVDERRDADDAQRHQHDIGDRALGPSPDHPAGDHSTCPGRSRI